MALAIMQPYIFPYIGYYQLINAVNEFVIYDDIEYTKRGWINRNRILINGKDSMFTLPLKKASDYLTIAERELADNFREEKNKLKNRLVSAYSKTPQFKIIYPVIEECLDFEHSNLFSYIFNSVKVICNYLEISTHFTISSSLDVPKEIKGEEKVLYISKKMCASTYINAIGGQELYSKERFINEGIDLKFIKTDQITYPQLDNHFSPNLSIIDVLMFNKLERVREYLFNYQLV